MSSRTLSAVAASVAALALAAVLAPAASAHSASSGARAGLDGRSRAASQKGAHVCFKNMVARYATGADVPSVNYDDQSSILDSQAADDFTLTEPCRVREVDVAGTFDEASQVDWETVFIYPDAGGKPGRPAIWVQSALEGTQGSQPGDFHIRFGPLLLQPGTYWISVQVQLTSGQWGWDNTTRGVGSPAMFQSPDGGFPGCPTWTPVSTCFPAATGPDLMFALKQ